MEAPVLDVSSWSPLDEEWLGEQEKVWLAEPDGPPGASRAAWLFKPSRRTELPGRRGASPRRFTWSDAGSEWIAHQLAALIGVPSAEIRLARREGVSGALSRDVSSPREDLHGGDLFLSELLGRDYIPNAEKARNRRGHNLEVIGRVLDGLDGPATGSGANAQETFAGYLLLDAWIGNTDRHCDNWALTIDGSVRRLAASFDHGSALAAGKEDSFLARTDPRDFADGAMAMKFENGKNVHLADLALDGMDRWGGPWLDALAEIGVGDERAVVDAVPGLSELRRRFICRLLEENRRRLSTP
ncbi:MAG: HipA domain-containing protein [Brachybacterium sp.]|uniref:HipA domain-containing protein n=1 Tax=Brachybacterium sp. TaxID=1891286 RepID=UPI0026537326|nr:HipA domain-containing protein [Brachybacterium sp.]MDN6302810.1 HipA domain-containing protein [Brachybacterium sp.]MDN6328004.1 HipA domain-containing protein [Brachybacterium sp.]MDN6398878.1 HipA domain-containing protein [Brachybacterium sp.]